MLTREGRTRLSNVLRAAGELVNVDDATAALGVDRVTAAKLLSRWHEQGWLRRVRRGLYVAVPLTANPRDEVLEDPWSLVPELFDPGYVGGLSAAQHWDLTEQLFRTVFVYTTRPVRRRRQTLRETPFVVRHIQPAKLFGTSILWRGRAKLLISDVHRTVVDMLDDPSAGGGIRHVADCVRAYFAHDAAEPARLVGYADRLGNGAVFKRLGFLAERLGGPQTLVAACAERLKTGNVKLDPALPATRLVTRWRLWVPRHWRAAARDD
ncbi:MAG TPA: type IV toxin-antitoxin system AbiEi family antitoxin domain-containing protein [Thermoanaerobaculia bacterium]|nr:type IV toxin-antitoxin system AbiEi family antitoxin domain-containing protein [Thermoanaerobaculia bacterium]